MWFLAVLALLFANPAPAEEKAKTEKVAAPAAGAQMTPEQRAKMADAHQAMATCLRSDRPLAECHDEMRKSCQDTMGAVCPMMGMGHPGPMKRPGRGPRPAPVE
jgi:hypothetical protein